MRHLLTSAVQCFTLAAGVAACSHDHPLEVADASVDAAAAVDAANTAKETEPRSWGMLAITLAYGILRLTGA